MQKFSSIAALHTYLRQQQLQGKRTVGLVPTMGAIHEGHVGLIQQARQDNAIVIVSIFVNPLQFDPEEDFQSYPRSLEKDCQSCAKAGADAIFTPSNRELGIEQIPSLENPESPNSLVTQVIPPMKMLSALCGQFRGVHFKGVATIVTKLFNLVQPDRAYFGQKDAQQLAILRRLVTDLNYPIEIVACPTVREANGLACSSRNQYLNDAQKQEAANLYHSLQHGAQLFHTGMFQSPKIITAVKKELSAAAPNIQIEYIALVHPQTLQPIDFVDEEGLLAIAARIGPTRLIDNVLLKHQQPIIVIDGPAGAGKSTVARQIAKTLGFLYLDTGAMYRAVTWLLLQQGISPSNEIAIAELVSHCQIELFNQNDRYQVKINGQDITEDIRSPEITSHVSAIASQASVRKTLTQQQQSYGSKGNIIAEGRDMGTHVFPNAALKVFLTASIQERAKRRQQDLEKQGLRNISFKQLEQEIENRDRKDSTRSIAPLRQAHDAIVIKTDNLTIEAVVEQIIGYYQKT